MRARPLAIVLVLALALPGCVSLTPAKVPDRLLEGRGGNGWAKNQTASQSEPTSAQFGMAKIQALVYEDRQSSQGFDGTLTVITLRQLLRPSESSVQEKVQPAVRDAAQAKGVRIEGAPATGTRTLANHNAASWFVYNGTVDQAGFFTARNAKVKIFGEVFQCPERKTIVVTVGLAQITDVRSVGGVPLPSDPDPTTWKEIVGDPRGTIEGARDSDGLAYNVQC